MSAPSGPFLYRGARATFRALALVLFRFRVQGAEHVPLEGPGVVVAHHRSWLDPACIGAACPRPIRFLILDEVYRKRWGAWFYRHMGSVPVQQGGARSLAALRVALRALDAGELVGVFPEGRIVRDGDAATIYPGAALLAVQATAPIVPVHIEGSSRAWPHGRRYPGPAAVSVRIGPPITPPASRERASLDALTLRMRRALEELAASAR